MGFNILNKIDSISTVSRIWLGGKGRQYPTLHILPLELAKKYRLDKPCKVVISARPEENGILIQRYDFDEGDVNDEQQQQREPNATTNSS